MNSKNEIKVETVEWNTHSSELSTIREAVFIKEQNVPIELEWDGEDETSTHLLALINETPVGTARLLKNGQIGRMCVLPAHRKLGIGTKLLRRAEKEARSKGLESVFLHAQSYIKQFYRQEGYSQKGSEFMDAGIPHIEMSKSLV